MVPVNRIIGNWPVDRAVNLATATELVLFPLSVMSTMVGASVYPVAGDGTARLVRTYSGVTQGLSAYRVIAIRMDRRACSAIARRVSATVLPALQARGATAAPGELREFCRAVCRAESASITGT